MNSWFQAHAGLVELVLFEGIVVLGGLYELRSIRRTLKKDRERAQARSSGSDDNSATAEREP